MNIPGFNAEALLYKTNKTYQIDGHIEPTSNIILQQADNVIPATCFGDCFQDCLNEGGMSKSGCSELCENECGGEPKDNPPYKCTPQDNSVNRNICLGAQWVWEQACRAECALLLGIPVVGPAAAAACVFGCTKVADEGRAGCPEATICV